MGAIESETREYFTPPHSYFWRWQDAGKVICWSDGRTMAFRDELLPILERLAADGLPPLGSILLLLAACRTNWTAPPTRRELLVGILQQASAPVRNSDLKLLCEACDRLDDIHHSLSTDVRTSMQAKAELCEMIFSARQNGMEAFQSTSVVAGLQLGLTPESLEPYPNSHLDSILRRDLQSLRAGLERFDSQALQLRIKTGLEQQVLPATIEIPTVGTARTLIAQLKDDPQLGGLARLARRLLSVVQWPRPLDSRSDLPCGGVSDIANRGPLDRLLLSELAYDDLTLAARVANGEALYLRREIPPSTPPRKRVVLLDAGIRVWGVPRIFGTAVGMALTAASDAQIEVCAYRAEGSEIVPVNFATQEGLVDHLSALDFRAHPGAAFEKWESLCAADANGADTVLITTEDVLSDPAFHRAAEKLTLEEWYIVTVNREGRFRQIRRTPAGGKLLREAQLSLDDVLEPKPTAAPLLDSAGGTLPAFVLQQPLPLLLSRPADPSRSWHVRHTGVLSLTNDARLLYWTHPSRGAQELAAGLPAGGLHSCTFEDGTVARAVIGRLGRDRLFSMTVRLETGRVEVIKLQLDADSPRGTFLHAGFIFVVYDNHVAAFDPQTGEIAFTGRPPKVLARHGRYIETVSSELRWSAISVDGGGIRFEPIPLNKVHPNSVKAIVDSADGPTLITRERGIHFPDGSIKPIQNLNGKSINVVAISRDNNRAIVEDGDVAGRRDRWLVYLLTGSTKSINNADPRTALEPALAEYARPHVMRFKFRAVAVDSSRRLTLISRHETTWPLEMQNERFMLPKQGQRRKAGLAAMRFESVDSWNNTPYAGLSIAKWPNGDRIILDTRGLLHCQAADNRVPEFTIALAEGETAGWCSDGTRWGPKFFCGDWIATPALKVFDEIIATFIEGLR